METTIRDLVDSLAMAQDGQIEATRAKLDRLRRLTSGADRELVCWALVECRELLTPAGRLRRALAPLTTTRPATNTRGVE
jgi:hypothetical protein